LLTADVLAFLEARRVAHLATASQRGQPHVVPVCFAVLGQTVYSAIDEKPKRGQPLSLRRVRNVSTNPQASLVADVYDDADWNRLGFVLLSGRARMIEPGGDEHATAVARLRERYAQYHAMRLEERPVLALDIERVTTWGKLEAAGLRGS
jgi:coenzyme F420-0:L-glutamate ligase / coenzyme F420-1:gamma-L-glutamate ligase